MDDYADACWEAAEHVLDQPAIIFGQSVGSTVAQLFTEQAGGNASAGFANWQRQGGQC